MSLTKASYSMITGAVVNVLDYGADPTGTADSTAAIQAAMTYAGTLTIPDTVYPISNNYGRKGGTTVFLPAGKYRTTATLNVPQNVNLMGAGRNSTMISSSYDGVILQNYVVPTATGEYSQPGNIWQDFCVNGVTTNANQIGINLLRWDLSVMSNVLIQNCGSHGLVVAQGLVSLFELVDCENNTGFGIVVRDGYNTSIDSTPNNLPTNACTFNVCHSIGNGAAGLLLAQFGSAAGVNGCMFNNCAIEYNSRLSAPGVGYNITITSDVISVNEFNDLWIEDTNVDAHIYVNTATAGVAAARFNNLHHFGNGASNYPNRCVIVNNGYVYLNNAFGHGTSYRNIAGSISPFRLNTTNSCHIWANNLQGSLVTNNNFVEDQNNVSTGLFNYLNMNNYGAAYGPSSLKGQAGVYLDQWATETQTYPFAAMEGGKGFVVGNGIAAPTSLITSGTGSPEGVVTATIGSLFLRTDGSTSTTLYVKTSGTGNTGWTAK